MSGSDRSNAWERYIEAKQRAFADETAATSEPQTLEELEEAIAKAAESSGIPETGMPPRSTVHTTVRKGSWSRWFYRILVFIFFCLVAGLIWWGNKNHGSDIVGNS